METREISKSSTNDLPDAKPREFSRRSILAFAGAIGAYLRSRGPVTKRSARPAKA
jgi:hypothetical protein